jgi:hypothetical protein
MCGARALPTPQPPQEHTLFLKKNIIVQGSYSSYMVLKSGTWQPALLGYGAAEDSLQHSTSAGLWQWQWSGEEAHLAYVHQVYHRKVLHLVCNGRQYLRQVQSCCVVVIQSQSRSPSSVHCSPGSNRPLRTSSICMQVWS